MFRQLSLFAVILCTLATGTHGDEAEQRSRLSTLKEQIKSLQQRLFSRNSEVDNLNAELEKRERAVAAVNKRINELDLDAQSLQDELTLLNERKGRLEAQMQAQRQMITKELNSAYRLGKSEPFKLLLNQEDPQKLARMFKYYHYFAKARRNKIEQFELTLAELSDVEADIASRREALTTTRETLSAELLTLKNEQALRRQTLASLNDALKDDKTRLSTLNKERQKLEDIIAHLEETILNLAPAAKDPFPKLKGKLPWPVAGKVDKSYGSFRAQSLKWSGWLIATDAGNRVSAVHNGRVVFADYLRGHGLMVIIDHGGGYLTLYAHNQVLLKETGDWVKSGDSIALAGNSGGLANSALYFEIRHNGKPQDPKLWLQAAR